MKCVGVIFAWDSQPCGPVTGRGAPGSSSAKLIFTAAWRLMEVNSIIILSLTSPKEKVWGQLLMLDSAGVTVRGIDLASFDDFVRQILDQGEAAVGMTTVFYPMHRVERIAADEPSGEIPSLADRFRHKVGVTIREYLGIETPRI